MPDRISSHTTPDRKTPSVKTDNPVPIPTNPSRFLFVCSGNICRSAYAAAKFKQLTQGRDFQIASAGILRLVGHKAAPEMIDAARENGVDLEEHRSNALSGLLIQAADVIFAFEHIHRDTILNIAPNADKKTILLGRFLNIPQEEIEDPMGQTPDVYRAVAAQIDEALTNWLQTIADSVKNSNHSV